MTNHAGHIPKRTTLWFFIIIIIIILAASACGPKPPEDTRYMVVTRTTRVIFQFNRPITVGILDEGARVKARPTSEQGWFEVWWRLKGRWKYGYVEADCLRSR